MAGPLGLYGRGGGVVVPLSPLLPLWGRGRSPKPRMAAVGALPVSWAPYGRRGGVAGPLGPIWPPRGVAGFLGPVWPPWGRGRSPKPRMAAVGALPVPWAPYGRRGGVAGPLGSVWPPRGVAGPLGPVWPPWGRGRSPKPRMAAVGA